MTFLESTIREIALSPLRPCEQRQAENHQFRQSIQRLRLVELRHIRAGRIEEAEQFRSIIDGLVAAWRRG